jgi:hypothetical protein
VPKKAGWHSDPGPGFLIEVIRHALTKNIAEKYAEMVDEIDAAFSDTMEEYTKPGGNGVCLKGPSIPVYTYLTHRLG